MLTSSHSILLLIGAVGCGLIGGVFFAFSTFIMQALAALPPAQGAAAMQSINKKVLNPWFLGMFFGSAVICVILATIAVFALPRAESAFILVASGFYLFGCFGVTVTRNVPLNKELDRYTPSSDAAIVCWETYQSQWTRWNHLRAAAALAASATLIAAGSTGSA